MDLKWEITPREKRLRVKGLILKFWLSVLPLVVWLSFSGVSVDFGTLSFLTKTGDSKFIFILLINFITVSIIALVIFMWNMVYPYKDRKYVLTDNYIIITKGKKVGKFLWKDFEYYYSYMERLSSSRDDMGSSKDLYKMNKWMNNMAEKEKKINGGIYHLRKITKLTFFNLYKVFVVIYSEPENDKKVSNFLSKHLKKTIVKDFGNSGMIFYKFK